MRPMRPAYNIGEDGKDGDDEWVIGGESNYRPEIPAQCSVFLYIDNVFTSRLHAKVTLYC